jgi:hypothetical protein
MAYNRTLKTKYFKQFTFSLDFDAGKIAKDFFIENHNDLSLLVQILIVNEIRKEKPFSDVVLHRLRPTKYNDNAFESESMKVLQLIRNLTVGRKDCPMHWLWLYKYRAGFTNDDAKLIEQCLYILIEKGMIEVINVVHSFSNDKEMLMVKPVKYLKKYDQKYELINANATLKSFKKGDNKI